MKDTPVGPTTSKKGGVNESGPSDTSLVKGFLKMGNFEPVQNKEHFQRTKKDCSYTFVPRKGTNSNITDNINISRTTNFAHLSPSQGCVGVPGPPAIVSGDHNNSVVHQPPVLQVDEHLEYHTRRCFTVW